jgi:phage baseplate assembly protein W
MKFKGMPYPIIPDAKGLLHTQSGIDQIKADLLSLLLTNPGERVFMPTYGTPLRTLMFEQNDQELISAARGMIIQSITDWEPRITVDAIEVTNGLEQDSLDKHDDLTEQGAILSIRIAFFDPEDILDVQELVLQLPLSGTSTSANLSINNDVSVASQDVAIVNADD